MLHTPVRGRYWAWPLVVVILLATVLPASAELAKEYQRNGECYLLVGHSDPTFRGVYRLNNPAGEPDGNPLGRLFDPQDSYGISVNLNRQVYTFSVTVAPTYNFDSSVTLPRLLKAYGGVALYGAHCDTRKSYYVSTDGVTYNQSNQPVYTTAGPMGNENGVSWGGSNISWGWSGIVWPTAQYPWGWYVQKTLVYCDGNCIYTNGYGDGYWCYFLGTDASGYGNVPNGGWWQSRDPDPAGRPGNLFYWDRAFRKYTKYDLLRWQKSLGVQGGGAPVYAQYMGPADSIYDEIVKRSRISACMNCVCVSGSNDSSFPTTPKYVWLALSPFGRTYLYSRTETSTADGQVRLNGSPMSYPATNIIGYLNDLSTKWIGVSSQNLTSDYVYLLGKRIVKEWLAAYSITVPADFDVHAVAVSDQWWLEGGIIFAYDKNNGYVYQFIRNDKGGANTCKSKPTSRYLGTNIDDVRADGFGNCFYSKTTITPATTGITWPQATSFTLAGTSGGRSYGYVWYNQKVDKTVYKSELGSTISTEVGKVFIGNNVFRRLFSVPDARWGLLTLALLPTEESTAGWQWNGALEQRTWVNEPARVQLGVINVATPPVVEKPNGRTGAIDIIAKTPGLPMYPNWTTPVLQGLYEFGVENAPEWNGKINIVTPGKSKWAGDTNGNGFEGGFVSSVKNDSASIDNSPDVLYTWRIYKIQDSYLNPLTPNELVKEVVDTTVPSIKCYLRSGVFQIECSTKFKWYNYDVLTFGSTVASLAECLRPTGGGYEIASAATLPDPSNIINVAHFPGMHAVPSKTAVYMVTVNPGPPPPTGTLVDIQNHTAAVPPPPAVPVPPTTGWKNPSVLGSMKYHVATQGQTLWWQIDPALLNNLWILPTITDSNRVPGTLKWQSDAQFDWGFAVIMPNGTEYAPLQVSRYTNETTKNTAITFGLDFPTDPQVGSLTCTAYRDWEYERNVYDIDGNYLGTEKVTGHVQYDGRVNVLVIDTQPPTVRAVNGVTTLPRNPLYYGTTYGLVDAAVPGYVNPASFSILVRDNNPFANMNTTSLIPQSRHNRATRLGATFYFERGVGKTLFPTTASPTKLAYYTSPGAGPLSPTTVPDITTTWVTQPGRALMRKPLPYTPSATYSETLYALNIANWNDMQDNTIDPTALDYYRRWPTNFANNLPIAVYNADGAVGAAHPGYGLMFLASDSSGNAFPARVHLGNVWIKDTLPPVAWASIRDYANSFPPEAILNNLPAYTSGVIRYDLLPTATLWTPDSSGNFYNGALGNVTGIPWSLASPLPVAVGTHPPEIQEGMEVFLSLLTADNIATATTPRASMSIVGPITGSLFFERLASSISANTSSSYPNIRVLLQHPGVYNCTLTVSDTAIDFPGTAAPNSREVRFGIIVSPTRMDIRVLDRKQNKF